MTRFFGLLACALLVCSVLQGYAQKDSSEVRLRTLNLDDLIAPDREATEVTSSGRTNTDLRESTYAIHVVTQQQILENGYHTLVDVLKDVPGIKTSQPGSAFDGESFVMRGLYGNYYTKILINNVPIMPSVAGGMPIGAQLPIQQAERIEIIYGPAGAVYGSDAMAGVINIITKNTDKPIIAVADLGGGSLGYTSLNLLVGGKSGQGKNILNYNLWGGFSRRNDLNTKYDTEVNYNPASYDPAGNYLKSTFFEGSADSVGLLELPTQSEYFGADVNFRNVNVSYQYMARTVHSAIGLQPLYSTYDKPGSEYGEEITKLTFRYQRLFRSITLSSDISWLHYRIDPKSNYYSVFNFQRPEVNYFYAASDDILAEQIATLKINSTLNLVGGVSYQVSGNMPYTFYLSEPFDPADYKPFSTERLSEPLTFDRTTGKFIDQGRLLNDPIVYGQSSAFAEFDYQGDRFKAQAGMRYDFNTIFGSSVSPRVAALYKFSNKHILRASVSMASRMPSSYYRFYALSLIEYPEYDTAFFTPTPNTQLVNERLLVAETGMRHFFSKNLSVEWTLFYNENSNHLAFSVLSDRVDSVGAIDFLGFGSDRDGSKNTLIGFQTNVAWKNIVEPIKLRADAWFSYQTGTYEFPFEQGSINRWPMVPEFSGQLRLSFYPHKKVMIGIRNHFSSSWLSRGTWSAMQVDQAPDLHTRKGYYVLDLNTRFELNRLYQIYARVSNVTNAEYAGIDATGTLFDLNYNPQMRRIFEIGISFRFN